MNELKNLFTLKSSRKDDLRSWCDETWPQLYRYIYTKVGNQDEAEDVTQEAYARIISKLNFPQLPTMEYLKTVALNIIRDRWRRRKIRGTQVQLEETILVDDRDIARVVDSTIVDEMMTKLSEEHQTVLRLRILEGYSRAETAKIMDKSEDAIRGLQYRAILNLRGLLIEGLKEEE